MTFRQSFRVLTAVAVATTGLASASTAVAQSFGATSSNSWAQRWEAFAGGRQSGSADSAGGSTIDIDTEEDLGFDFGAFRLDIGSKF